jgi:hypothetical protein
LGLEVLFSRVRLLSSEKSGLSSHGLPQMIWPLCRDSLGIGRHTPIYLILFALPSFNLDIGSGLSKEDIEPLS